MDAVLPYVAAVVPTIVIAAFFYAIITRIIEGDRRERMAQRRLEAEEDERTRRARTDPAPPAQPQDPQDPQSPQDPQDPQRNRPDPPA